MIEKKNPLKLLLLCASFVAATTLASSAVAQAQMAPAQAAPTPVSPKVAAGDVNVKQLVLLMDTDKDGKISKKEFLDFMAAEFDRLDTDKSGELDVKELTKSQITSARSGGTRR